MVLDASAVVERLLGSERGDSVGGSDFACNVYRYAVPYHVIRSIRHRGLRRLYEDDDASKLRHDQVERIRDIMEPLDVATRPGDMSLPGLRLHPLKGKLRGSWSVSVSGNWRIIFRFEDGDAYDVDLVDYH